MKNKLYRIWSTIEVPAIYMLLSLQSDEQVWRNVWFGIAMYKFIGNVYIDYMMDKHFQAMKDVKEGFDEIIKKHNKKSKK